MTKEGGRIYFERRRSKPSVREAAPHDIPRLVEIDLEGFADVYDVNPVDRDNIHSMLEARQEVAGPLMVVGEIDGKIEGFMTCQRTNITPEELRSWDETTNHGTLTGTHNPIGRNFYVVNLTVTEKGSEYNLSDQLIARMYGRFLEIQGEKAYLLSRMPQFAQWLAEQGITFEDLSDDNQDELAWDYTGAAKVVAGKKRLYDGMLHRYSTFGAKPLKILRDGFTDPASHNYSVLCVVENPLPPIAKRSTIVSCLAGKSLSLVANHPFFLSKLP